MAKDFIKISGSRVEFPLIIEEKEFKSAQQKVIERHKSHTAAKGFRKGHAPDEAVIASVGIERITNEAIDQALSDQYQHFVHKHDLKVINRPAVDFGDKPGFPMKAKVSVEVFPEIQLKGYEKLKMKKVEVKVSPTELEEIIETLMAQALIGNPVDRPAKNKDLIEADFAGKDDAGKVLPNTEMKKNKFRIGLGHYLADLEKAFEGMKAGESKQGVKVKFPKDYHSDDFAGKVVLFDITLHGVYEIDPKALKEDDIEKIMGQKESPEKFRATLQTNVEQRQRQQKEDEAIKDYQLLLASKVKGDLPQSWIDQEVHSGLERIKGSPQYQQHPEGFFKAVGHTEDSFRKDLEKKSEENLRSFLGLREIIEKEGITLDKEEQERAAQEAENQKVSLEHTATNRRIDKYLRGLMLDTK